VNSIAPTLEKVIAASLRRSNEGPLSAWPVVCGSAVAERTRAVNFRGGILWVEVPDAGWRAEMQYLMPQYLIAMNKYSTKRVNRIEFVLTASK
jgi:hypothetical protein